MEVSTWTWGAKPTHEAGGWIERLAGAILDRFTPAVAGSTEGAEKAFGWPQSTYWYVASVNEAYSSPISFWAPNETLQDCTSSGITPFDTGGLVARDGSGAYYVVGDPPFLHLGDRITFVHGAHGPTLNYPGLVLRDLASRWAPPSIGNYKAGRPPNSAWPRLQADIGNPYTWTWEGRVAVDDLHRRPLTIRHLFWTPELQWQFLVRVGDARFRVFGHDLTEEDRNRIQLWLTRNATVFSDVAETVSQARGAL